ncbi:restriction endonuclease subunit S [Rhizobium oryzicola]|uniref:Restriction endonuclease subunit S n=1 Tax=Rhizobium oryzicola TaxID=1232668 RepID=A0ABT8SR99_9HYPH|nr:restriction endonuclease subunit S [Rhizobium oryzicola]MDO1580962.1 restriction endonuclease subunit S [Rhizobium oryzicola]
MTVAVLADLLEFTRDGEWGEGEAGDGLVNVGIIRGTDFSSVRYGDLSGIPTRYVRAGVVEKKQLRPGDVLIETAGGTKDQPTGRTVYLRDELFQLIDKPLLCASFARFLRVREGSIDPQFLFWKLQDEYLRGELLPYHVQHTGVARFQYTQFASTHRLVVPDTADEQKAIASVLSAIEEKIQLNRRMNETLEALAQAIFKDWFVSFGPTRRKMGGAINPVAILGGLISDPAKAAYLAALFSTNLGEDGLPQGWELREIGEQSQALGGSTPSTKEPAFWEPAEHCWATPKDLSAQSDLALFETERKISDAGLARITSGLLPAGTVLLSSRAPIGYLAISQVPIAINQGFIALPPSESFGTAYLYFWCKANMEQIQANANGSTFQEISKRNFRPIKSAVPSDERILTAFVEIVDPLIARIVSAANENRTLAETRDYLLPKLMSGAVRVRDAERAVS